MEKINNKLEELTIYLQSKNIEVAKNSSLDDIILYFKNNYPNIIIRIMKSVNYSNHFKDENLKQIAHKLEVIFEYLDKLKIIDRDKSVDYYNSKIVEILQHTDKEKLDIILHIDSTIYGDIK